MLDAIDDFDWHEVFKYTDAEDIRVALGSEVSTAAFTAEDVEEIFHISEGENDESSWLCMGRLEDGRFFHLSAWCDYTGWGCQEGGGTTVSHSLEHLMQYGIDNGTRMRFGLETI